MNILLACFGGVTTSLLAKHMMEAAKKENKECFVLAVDDGEIAYELEKQHVDIVLLGPQIAFKEKIIQKRFESFDVPIRTINMADYSSMNGANVLHYAEKIIREKK